MNDVSGTRAFSFLGGEDGTWSVTSHHTLLGEPIAPVARVEMVAGFVANLPPGVTWKLSGVATNDRYTDATEKAELIRRQAPIGRPSSTRSALILLRKTAEWWALPQDERRDILEEQSHHIAIGLRYLPAISRRLLHCRDMGTDEPFDFIGFLDFAPADEAAFDDMLGELRATREWAFMDREIEIRLSRS